MKTVLAKALLALVAAGLSQGVLAGGTQNSAPDGPKVIKDAAEYNTYIAALNTADPAQKAAAMESFLKQYPNSVVAEDALEQAMASYQQSGNQSKVAGTAFLILQHSPDNLRALAIEAFLKRAAGTPQAAAEGRVLALRGMTALPQWQKPEGLKDTEFEAL